MKIANSEENLSKDLNFMLKTFSMEVLNIEVGLRMKKIELKLSTFLYICRFFAVNKSKQRIKIDEVFELIFIMAKIHRLFTGLEKASFYNKEEDIPISASCLADLKMCVDSLSHYYEYSIL